MKKKIIIILGVLVLIGAGCFVVLCAGVFEGKLRCLKQGEKSIHSLNDNGDFAVLEVRIFSSKGEKSFSVDNIRTSSHPIEFYNCGIYLIKEFGIDYKKLDFLPGFSQKIWRYDYNGKGKKIITLAERKVGMDEPQVFFSTSFRVEPNEQYIALIQGYLGADDYALVIKDLETLEDVFVLSMKDVDEQNLLGNLHFDKWSKDGRYFWSNRHDGAIVNGYIRIDTNDWSYDIFPTPTDILGGDALNPEKALVTRHPKNIWIGVAELTEQEKEARREQGIGTELHIFNLETQKSVKIDETTEPLHYFRPEWLSDTELQYEMPSGGKRKVYSIK